MRAANSTSIPTPTSTSTSTPTSTPVAALLLLGLVSGCITAPDVVLLDRKTVLEEQASGELVPLENDLREAAIVPHRAEFTRGQLQEAGVDLSQGPLSTVVQVYGVVRSEAELIDELLVRRCVGEGRNGLLVETPATCSGRSNVTRTSASVQRINRSRRQLWQYIQDRQPGASEEEVKDAWLRHHLSTVVCGGQVQSESGDWEVKRC
jgi:uncharacterized protein YdbL (DUF1318 family)